jgi:protein-S-isoprenylcysteine O-methyltransferase Ste14
VDRKRPMIARLARQWESPPVWLLVFVALAVAQSAYLPLLPTGRAGEMLGARLIVAGLAVFALALVQFRRHRTTVLPREEPRAMIRTGIYALSRNPIYLADAMILAGVALRLDAASLILVPVFVAVIRVRFIEGEEAVMRARFGAEYAAYAARVRRWI